METLQNIFELEPKNCELCMDTGFVHVSRGWKDFSFGCPNCKPSLFETGVKNLGMIQSEALGIICMFGEPGDG